MAKRLRVVVLERGEVYPTFEDVELGDRERVVGFQVHEPRATTQNRLGDWSQRAYVLVEADGVGPKPPACPPSFGGRAVMRP